ncbi:poly [ADP-ribose] polymerase tankyrase-like isoform X3 [Porites lutea]|uniref:poly [ADP-ribose] polymerase tankyrase-like isoform X3 n=1 Tax=Porites lutea TaxID=51062 RepID=UPI003CC5A579
MASRPRLLKKQSSLAILVELERETCESASRPPSEADPDQVREEDLEVHVDEEVEDLEGGELPPGEDDLLDEKGDGDSEGGDTDAAVSSEDENDISVSLASSKKSLSASARGGQTRASVEEEEIAPPLRMSRRLMSMKRRGKVVPLADLTEEFEFYAGDVLTVRGEEGDFYVCRVLEDVPESATSFGVAWFNRVDDNLYEVSFDDVCYMDSVITRVALSEVQPEKYSISKPHIKQTKKLLKEALAAERGEEEVSQDEGDDDDDDELGDEDAEEAEDEPPAKRTRSGSRSSSTSSPAKRGKRGQKKGAATPVNGPGRKRKAAEPKEKKERKKKALVAKKDKPRRAGVLIPNENIKLLEKDPTFETSEDIPLMPVKWAIKAVLVNDMEMLKSAIENRQEVFTVHWPRSPEIQLAAVHYALLNQNHEALKLLLKELHEEKPPELKRHNQPTVSLNHMDTGTYNFYTFGHAVRELYSSRGSREGNNAFLEDDKRFHRTKGYGTSDLLPFCFKKGVPLETVKVLLNEMTILEKSTLHEVEQGGIDEVWHAIRSGNRKLAGYFVSKGVDKFGFGFNFLHKEVLLNDSEELTSFRSQSVKKKPVENKTILPIHAACINPNGDYLKALLNSVPEHSIPDRDGFKPIHYAAACEGPGPLKVLLARGADPNDPGPKGVTPLMIACKYGRDENVKELVAAEDEDVDDALEDGEQTKSRVTIDVKNKHTKAAIHYAARNGHLSIIRLLVAAGGNVDLQTGSYRGNVTALMLAATQGHLELVKALVELKASPDKKGKWNKTALMYAVKNGQSPVAAYLLRIGVNPCAADTSGNTPVHYAAAYGWLHCLKMLIEAGADPNAANQWKVTPLAIALMKDQMPCADYLLSLDNVDVNFPDDCGRTLLCQKLRCSALNKALVEKITYLVEKKGADVNKADVEQWTPLHYLAANSVYEGQRYDRFLAYHPPPMLKMHLAEVSCQLARLFISAGADPDAVNKDGRTPMMVAILQNNFPLIETLLECGAKGSVGKTSDGSQVLHVQAEKADDLDLSDLYPDAHVDLTGNTSEQREQKQKHLKSLVMRASNEMMEKLIAGGAEINCVRSNGLTPLMLALSEGNMDQFSMLLDHDADPSMGLDKTGRNLLHLLATMCTEHDLRRHMKIVLKKTKSENLKEISNLVDNNGFTPLLQACETIASSPPNKENNEFVKSFIKTLVDQFGCSVKARVGKVKKGVNVELRNPPTFGLRREKDDEVDTSRIPRMSRMKQRSWSGSGSSYNSDCEDEDEDDVEMDEDEKPTKGLFTCLHFLVYESWNFSPFLELMLEYVKAIKSIVNSFDCHGRTPLHLAVKWGNTGAAKLLIDSSTDVNVRSLNIKQDGKATPLILASRPVSVRLATLKDLLEAKADPNIADNSGRTALSWAVSNPNDSNSTPLKLCTALLEAGADVNSADGKQRTPLHYSVNCTTGGFETITDVENLLIKYGADTTTLDLHRRIPLHYAFVKMNGRHTDYSMSDPISVVGLLCEAMAEQGKDVKAQVNHQDNFGQTPLHRAALRGSTICSLNLIQKGASLDIKDNDGNTPLSLAVREGHNGCAMMFMQSNAPASCQVIKPLTPDDWKNYEIEKKKCLWQWKNVVDLSEPKPDIRSAFRVVIDNNWQGIAYLMLEVAGLDFIEAIQATLESNKLDLAWALLRKQRKDASVQGVDKKGRNLLHLLAIHSAHLWTQVVEEIANHLVQRGVPAGAVDSQGATPLHYAACNHNLAFCRFLWEHSPSSLDVTDKGGVTPFAAVFSNTESGIITLVEFFVSPSNCHVKNLDVCYSVGEEQNSKDTTTPLIEAALSSNEKVVTYLLKHGASVNFPKHDGRTPLMEIVRSNAMDMVKVLIYATDDRKIWETKETTLVDLTLQDNEGKSVIHHCVQNREYGSAENVDLLKFLASFEAPLALRDSQGHTPLYYAKQQGSGVMAEALIELLGQTEANRDTEEPMESDSGFNFTTSGDELWEGPVPDPTTDAEKILQEAREKDKSDNDDIIKVKVDSAFRMEGGGEVYVDPDTGVPYDILMSKVDVKYGMFGLNNFYKMQIIHHKAKDLWVLFNRWGRVGDSGQHQRTPYNDPDTATAEFKKIFKSKTGNEWVNKGKFQKHPRKYALVLPERNPENKRKRMNEVLKPFELDKCPASRLPEEVQSFMKAITNFGVLKSAMSSGIFRVDEDYMPFGRLSKDTLEKAREVLREIKAIVETIDRRNLEGTEEKFEKIAELSNTYYMLMPMASYTYERIKPLNDINDIERHLDALYNLTELADASKILLGAQYRNKEVNPLDYVYKSLGCHVELLDPNSEECQLILEYIHNSRGRQRIEVEAVFRVSRLGEAERLKNCGVPGNHRLLWHGTNTANMIGILQQGLRIAPPEASRSGWSLGKGIYSSDSLDKSMNYVGFGSAQTGFVLLCEVALGKVKEVVDREYHESAPEGFDSVLAVSSEIPDPSEDVTTPYGAKVPAGVRVTQPGLAEKFNVYRIYNRDSEYVVYKESQVLIRYVVQVKRTWR